MKTERNAQFEQQIDAAQAIFPSLRIKGNKGDRYLRGILNIADSTGSVVTSYLVEIRPRAEFPLRFPYLLEVGGDIPRDADRHKYDDDSCCITVPAEETIECRHGITIKTFIERFCIPFLANDYFRRTTGRYASGEYEHGLAGVAQYYLTLFKTIDMEECVTGLEWALSKHPKLFPRNERCYCECGIKFKNCHLKPLATLLLIDKKQLQHDLVILKAIR